MKRETFNCLIETVKLFNYTFLNLQIMLFFSSFLINIRGRGKIVQFTLLLYFQNTQLYLDLQN